MRTDLDHLPANKREELDRVVASVFEDFRAATAEATGKRKSGRILKIILFGSYARDDWVDAPMAANRYKSDFDLLIIVNQKDLTDRATYWSAAEERLIREHLIEKTLGTPVNFIVHSLQQVNDGLAHGRTFFLEIARDGIALYESDDRELHQPRPKTPTEALAAAREYFEDCFSSSMSFFRGFRHAIDDGDAKKAAFDLHQATERLYNCLLLTLTFYTPYNHNLAFLRTQAERLDRRLFEVWPRDMRKDRAMFEKLKDAYVKARYSKHYSISDEELTWLSARVEALGVVVHAICTAHIDELARLARH
ncbi:nucleotidyltransferase and HEPN domain-containing protein [Sphingomonas glacialis]|uniref:HEPN domain-containing protein n=1 Tax=Sphingomonas glacialis TaxID=658225 RepID=A0A502FF75_9SPHN|nr:HEPN domain-containing protein [Sphingomonas glacialis]TPG48048.1 HEPN domain-containing protein [Sphingomonas glacialis]